MRDFEALDRFLAERARMPFAWGSAANDCISFYAAAARAMADHDPIEGLKWSSEIGAARVIRRLGGLAAAVSSRMTPVAPAFAMRGDAAAVEHPEHGLSLMLVEGETLVAPGERGLERHPRSAMIFAWTLPNG